MHKKLITICVLACIMAMPATRLHSRDYVMLSLLGVSEVSVLLAGGRGVAGIIEAQGKCKSANMRMDELSKDFGGDPRQSMPENKEQYYQHLCYLWEEKNKRLAESELGAYSCITIIGATFAICFGYAMYYDWHDLPNPDYAPPSK